MMQKDSRIYVAGHRGLVGSAIMRNLKDNGFFNIITRGHSQLDLVDQSAVRSFFAEQKPEYVFLAAARVGGIVANNTFPAEFIHQNLNIQTNIIHESYLTKVKRLIFLGSSCIYPRECPQPMKEEHLLTGPLEPTNRPYAVAKIAGIEMCSAYNRQFDTQYLAVMPTNLYGPGDNYDLENSHVLPALIRKMHEAKKQGKDNVLVWGTGFPRREFLYSDDMAEAVVFLANLPDHDFVSLIAKQPPLVNIGCGQDQTIEELAELVKDVVSFRGELVFDDNKPDGMPQKLLSVDCINKLGWKAQTKLKDGIKKAYNDFLLNDP